MITIRYSYFLSLVLSLLMLSFVGVAQQIPDPPNPPRLVVDYTGTLEKNQVQRLEQALVAFNDSTSTQILVVLVPSLNGLTKEEFADQLGEKWGVGQKGKNNGIVVLVKPKSDREKGEARISVGYGLEGAVPDAIANRIVDNEMIPHFKNNDYFSGLVGGVKILMSLTVGEYTAEDYAKGSGKGNYGFLIILLIFAFFFIFFRNKKSRYYSAGRTDIPWWILMGSMMNSGRHSGSWGDFKSGSGGFGGGGGGGFGGFGGGSFGGGGAGGSW